MDLMKGARIAVTQCLAVKRGERVAIIADTKRMKFAAAFERACAELGAQPEIVRIPESGMHGAEPPAFAAAAMKQADVFIAPTTWSITHTKARQAASATGARGATLPGVTAAMFGGPMTADYKKIAALCRKMNAWVKRTKSVRITSPSGTKVAFSIAGRRFEEDNGLYRKPGQFGNLPAGEVFGAPVEGSGEGVIVFDSMGDVITRPGAITVRKGRATGFDRNAGKFKQMLEDAGPGANVIAEFGIGCNPKAKLSGNVLEDEKVFGTVHIAFGNNTSMPGGKNYAKIHMDGIILKPDVWLGRKKVIGAGRWLI